MPWVRASIGRLLAPGKKDNETEALLRRNLYLERYMRTSETGHEIVNAIRSCNLLFRRLTNVEFLLREDIEAMSVLFSCFEDQKDFLVMLGALAGLFEADLAPIRAIMRGEFEKDWKLLKLLEHWLQENEIAYDAGILQTWRAIIDLRNASFPYHSSDTRVVDLLQLFGQGFPIQYAELCDSILSRFLVSLNSMQSALSAAVYAGR